MNQLRTPFERVITKAIRLAPVIRTVRIGVLTFALALRTFSAQVVFKAFKEQGL